MPATGREAERGALSLPQVTARRAQPPRSRVAPWRAAVLILVHAAIIAHVMHWWITGRSVGRFVLSDSMRTLEQGEVNPGFLLFAAALLASILAGRFLCGWACHMGALQDLAAWMLRRIGFRPRMFRSRLLGYVPLALAAYMFIWPTVRREVVRPLLRSLEMEPTGSPADFPGFRAELATTDMWSGLPGWAVGVPFLLLSGVATVCFLGARGLCHYVCPYGGLMIPAESLAPARIVADRARCDQCGLCTSTCAAGVRVHLEVQRHGAVLDGNCARTMDCISVCPQGALSFGLSMPRALRRGAKDSGKRSYDLSLGQEAAALCVFALVFFAARGAYGVIPLLLAATIGALAAFIALKAWSIRGGTDVRLGSVALRRADRMTPAGAAFAAGSIILGLLTLQSAAVRVCIAIAENYDGRVRITLDAALAGSSIPDDQRENARAALRWYRPARSIFDGGIGLATTPAVPMREAWMHVVLGERCEAIDRLRMVARLGRAEDHTGPDLARLLYAEGRPDEARDALDQLLRANPRFVRTRETLASLLASEDRAAEGEALLLAEVTSRPHDAAPKASLGRFYFSTGRPENGIVWLARAATDAPRDPAVRRDHAIALMSLGKVRDAVSELRSAAAVIPAVREEFLKKADEFAGWVAE